MYQGYLCLGGQELGNNARAQGYAESADCSVGWFVGEQSDGLAEALGDARYTIADISSAPWYDPSDESSSRFYGAYITSLGEISSSTREGTYTEGMQDGGIPGNSRRAGKSFRVRAWLTAAGEDALETGHSWLDAALQAQTCGTHAGGSCGSADLTMFTASPPRRAMIPDLTPWVQQAENLFTNPSAEKAGGPIEVRQNLAPNPRAVDSGFPWVERHGGGGTATLGYLNPGAFGPTPTLTSYVQAVRTSDAPAGNSNWLRVSQLTDVVPVVGEAYTLSAWVRTNVAGRIGVTLQFTTTGGSTINEASNLIDAYANVWYRVYVTVTAGSGAERIRIEGSASNSVTDTQIKATGFLLEKGSEQLAYFDGETSVTDPDYSSSWLGAVNNGPSSLAVRSVTGARGGVADQIYHQTADDPFDGEFALRAVIRTTASVGIAPQNMALTAGKTYTLLLRARSVDRAITVTPRIQATQGSPVVLMPGVWTEIRATLVAGTGSSAQTGLLLIGTSSGHQIGDRIDVDNYLITEGTYSGEWFSGDTYPDAIGAEVRTRWLGAELGSSSVIETRTPYTRPETDEEYDASVAPYVRHLHDVICISGPLEIETRRSADGVHWGRLVEFTLYAGKPWFYGETKRLERNVVPAAVVQDAPFNLAISSSAELAGAVVVAATNYSLNPSVEVDAADWAAFSQQVTGSVVAARVTGELAAAGSASHRTTFTASAAGEDGAVGVEHTVIVPAVTASTRMSVTLWASALVFSGTATLGQIVSYVMWYNGSTFLTSQDIGASPANGGPLSTKSLKPPVGATKAVIRAYVNVPSYSSGAVVRFYADAAGVTVP